MFRERLRRRVVEDDGGGQPDAGRGVEPVAQLDPGQRVEPRLVEGAARVERRRVGVAEDPGHGVPHQGQYRVRALVDGERGGELRPAAVAARGLGRRPGAEAALTRPRSRAAGGSVRARSAARSNATGARGGPSQERAVEEREPLLRGERPDPGPAPPGEVGLTEGGAHAVGGVQPGQRGGGQAERVAVCGQGVQEGVGGRVVGLPGGAGEAGDGQRRANAARFSPCVQVVRCQARVGALGRWTAAGAGGQRLDGGVVEQPRRVDDAGQRMLCRYGAEQCGDLVAVGHVARGDRDLGAELFEGGAECGHAGGPFTAATGQQQVAYAVAGDEVAGEERAESAGAAGDQYRPSGSMRKGL
ncbi:hypothetical protein SMICM304S_10913 [Streptomyces microflavus]